MTVLLWVLLAIGAGSLAFIFRLLYIIGAIWEAAEQDDRPWEASTFSQPARATPAPLVSVSAEPEVHWG